MLREKLIIASSPERYILVDASKRVEKLGLKVPDPLGTRTRVAATRSHSSCMSDLTCARSSFAWPWGKTDRLSPKIATSSSTSRFRRRDARPRSPAQLAAGNRRYGPLHRLSTHGDQRLAMLFYSSATMEPTRSPMLGSRAAEERRVDQREDDDP